jgi:hypothetical protein
MRFMIMVRATGAMEAGRHGPESLFAEMTADHEELAKAGVLLDAAGLQPSVKGWRIGYAGDRRTVVDGPFAETKELIAGYTLIQTKTREEAFEWAEIEVRQLFELEDFAASPAVQRFRELMGDAR